MKTKNKIFIISAVFILAALVLVVFFIWPALTDIKKNADDLSSGKNSLYFLEAQVSEIESFKRNYDAYKPNLEKIDSLFVNAKDPVGFIKFIEKTASDNEVDVELSLASKDSTTKSPGTWPLAAFQIACEGDFSNVAGFSEKLEKGPYLVKIQNLTIRTLSKGEAGNEEGRQLP